MYSWLKEVYLWLKLVYLYKVVFMVKGVYMYMDKGSVLGHVLMVKESVFMIIGSKFMLKCVYMPSEGMHL